jgi:molecular chaperone DnaK
MDADGILEVSAVEVGTGRASTVTIEASSGLTQDEINQLGNQLSQPAARVR